MNWIKTVIYTTKEGIEPVCGQLLNVGINGTQIEDEDDFNDFFLDKTFSNKTSWPKWGPSNPPMVKQVEFIKLWDKNCFTEPKSSQEKTFI